MLEGFCSFVGLKCFGDAFAVACTTAGAAVTCTTGRTGGAYAERPVETTGPRVATGFCTGLPTPCRLGEVGEVGEPGLGATKICRCPCPGLTTPARGGEIRPSDSDSRGWFWGLLPPDAFAGVGVGVFGFKLTETRMGGDSFPLLNMALGVIWN